MIPYTLTPQGISLLVDSRPRIISRDHLNFNAVLECVKSGDVEAEGAGEHPGIRRRIHLRQGPDQ
jgi:hypothetical protein